MTRAFAVILGIISTTVAIFYLITGFVTMFTTAKLFNTEGVLTPFIFAFFLVGGLNGGLRFISPRLALSKKEKAGFKPSDMPVVLIRKAYKKGAMYCIVCGVPSIFLVAEEVTPGALVVVVVGILGLMLAFLPAKVVKG